MAFMIELTAVQEAQLAAAARMHGLDVGEFAKNVLTKHLPKTVPTNDNSRTLSPLTAVERDTNHFYFTATPEEFNHALDEIAAMNQDLPVLPPEAFDRENLYEV